MSGYKNIFNSVKTKLAECGIENADFEARELLGSALETDCRSAEFEKMFEGDVSAAAAAKFLELCNKRASGEPLQYLIGEWEFYGLPFRVGEGVLIPRQDTETLVDIAVSKGRGANGLKIADLCSGSGCIGIALEKNLDCSEVHCVDRSAQALKYLEINKQLNNSNVCAYEGDVLSPAAELLEKLSGADMIVCNPPYLTAKDMKELQKEVTFEPSSALYGGEDGLDFYRGVVRIWKDTLKEGGTMLFEIGAGQEQEVMQILIQHGFKDVRAKKDLCGIYRVVSATKA